jgi:hypothetical protein
VKGQQGVDAAAISARGTPTGFSGIQQNDHFPGFGQCNTGPQASETATHNGDITVDLGFEWVTFYCRFGGCRPQ